MITDNITKKILLGNPEVFIVKQIQVFRDRVVKRFYIDVTEVPIGYLAQIHREFDLCPIRVEDRDLLLIWEISEERYV